MNITDAQGQKLIKDSATEAKRKGGLTRVNVDPLLIADLTLSLLTFGPLLGITKEEGDITSVSSLKEATSRLVFCVALKNGEEAAERQVDELSYSKLQDFAKSMSAQLEQETAKVLARQVRLRVQSVLRGGRHESLEAPFRVEDLVELIVRQSVRLHFMKVLEPAWLTYKLKYNKYIKGLDTRAIIANSMADLLDTNSLCFRRAYLGLTRISQQWIALCYPSGERRPDRDIVDLCAYLGWHGKQGLPIECDDVDSRLSYHLKNEQHGLAATFSEELAMALEQLVRASKHSGNTAYANVRNFLVAGSLRVDRKRLKETCKRDLGAHGRLVSDELKQLCKRLNSVRSGGALEENNGS